MVDSGDSQMKLANGDSGYVLEDVPHLTDYIPDLPVNDSSLSVSSYISLHVLDYATRISTYMNCCSQEWTERDTLRRAGPRQKVYFKSDEVYACIVTCGGLCPGLNTVIREIVCGLYHMYGVSKVLGIDVRRLQGFLFQNTISMTPKFVNDIHKRGGTILGTSRGGHDTSKIVDSIQDRGINQVYIIGGDGTQKGAAVIYEEIQRRGLKVAVAGIPKPLIMTFQLLTSPLVLTLRLRRLNVQLMQHMLRLKVQNGIGVVKLMGRYSGFIAMYATLASRDVDCCLIPESPFYLEGKGGLFEFIKKRLKENGHMVIVIAEGAGQDLLSKSLQSMDQQDASGISCSKMLGYGYHTGSRHCASNFFFWELLFVRVSPYGMVEWDDPIDHFAKENKMNITLKYIDPTYMIRAIPANASDNVYCTLLAHSAIHGAMAGYTGFTVGPVNGRHAYIPFNRVTEKQNKVVITDRMWARLLSSTDQPSFMSPKVVNKAKKREEPATLLNGNI
ncbi:hypothetical protein GH714_041511 [Hevea brasiliensis]|uniref:Phosphofructokinase domain-containing protein n=1 Tax=Hevea brasiliensis TaxID=3981 RepID=A0A6A6MRI1_HEVBR|nr:hypothetical protein GH714_041511 [Hevea brasiliensis]